MIDSDFLLVLVSLLCSVAAVSLGIKQKESLFVLFLAFILGPLGLILVFLKKGNARSCPFCKENIRIDAVICQYCKKDIPPIVEDKSENTLRQIFNSMKESQPNRKKNEHT